MSSGWLLYAGFSAGLVFLGIYCLLTMRNLIKLLIGVEIIAKGVTLLLIATGFARGNVVVAQCLVITFIVIEVSIMATALAIVINLYRHHNTIDIRKLTGLKG
jgi:multisubunit Na+/H+ antiporter MnhC subunit